MSNKTKSILLYTIPPAILFILAIVFCMPIFSIGDSMEPTFDHIDYSIGYRASLGKGLTYSKVVKANFPSGTIDMSQNNKVSLIKRVIALGGDTIESKEGFVYLNGQLLKEPYLTEGTVTYYNVDDYRDSDFKYELGLNEVFLMGDSRGISVDSRFYGPIKENKITYILYGDYGEAYAEK